MRKRSFQRCSEPSRYSISRAGCLILLYWSIAAHAAVMPADTVFRGSAILTLDVASPNAEAIAIRAGRIVYVGERKGVAPYVGARTRVVELGNRLLMPAFIDAHIHPVPGGLRLLRCKLEAATSPDDIVARLRDCTQHKSSSGWLIVNGLDDSMRSHRPLPPTVRATAAISSPTTKSSTLMIRRASLNLASARTQPAWAWHDPVNRDVERRLGRTRADMLVPIGRLFAAGARVVAGSDWPAPVINPLQVIQIAVTRHPLDGSESVWHPKQRVTLMQMLRAYVVDAAWVMRLDQVTGSITVGRAADLIVFDRDLRRVPVMDLQKVTVVMTMFEGRVVYRGKRW